MSVDVATSRWQSVAWKRVAQYYGIAFGGAVVVGLGIWGIRQVLPASLAVITQTVTAVFYMPLPIVASSATPSAWSSSRGLIPSSRSR